MSRLLALATGIVVVAVGAAGLTATQASATTHRHRHRVVRICRHDQLYRVTNYAGEHLIIRNDTFGGSDCLSLRGRTWSRFRVTRTRRARNGTTFAYPNIFYGCEYGKCSARTARPKRVSSTRRMRLTWQTRGNPRGLWNKGFDVWYYRHYHVGGQPAGAEIMIWLNAKFRPPWGHRIVRLAGYRWWFATHTACNAAKHLCWKYILFRKVVPAMGVRGLALHPFERFAEHRGLLKPYWFLGSVDAGFELWHGGGGLTTVRFAVTR